ncbi:MAG: ArsI/CadI family heavy metal resistance metalloenzyme [Bacteroidia bacterium]
MKRFHINIKVADLEKSISFYSALFHSAPTVQKTDYAKWMLEDPRINFAITLKPENTGIEHLGIQAESVDELRELYQRVDQAEGHLREEGDTVCCYAQSTKGWVKDPEGVDWEMFYTYGESDTFYQSTQEQKICCS